jgi:two-component system LytT family response regulator
MSNAIPVFAAEPRAAFEPQRIAKEAILIPDYGVILPEIPTERTSGKSGKVVLPTMEGLCFEKTKHITYLEANGNYTMLHFVDKRQILVCKTLRDVELMLPEDEFVRIHRSHTVNLKHLKKYVRGKGGYVVLQNGVSLAVSAGQKEQFVEAVKNYF